MVKSFRAVVLVGLLAACAAPPTVAVAPSPAPPTATAAPAATPVPSPTPRCPPSIAACPATQLSLAAPAGAVNTYDRVELTINTDGAWANPYDPAQVDLQVRFTPPAGQAFQVPAFWYQDFDPATLEPKGAGGWRARFTPTQPGAWQAQAMLAQGSLASQPVSLSVAAADPAARGFVQINPANPRYFGFAGGGTFLPIGLNLAWADSLTQTVAEYTRWLGSLSQSGGNVARVWMASWSLGIEWKDTGLGDYSKRQEQAWLLDQVFSLAEQDNVYILLSLLNHGAFSTTTDPNWSDNPYNVANGGMLTSTVDFATNPAAQAFFQRRVRYIAARWGYSTHLFAWEWWNEVNFTGIPDSTLQPWIGLMTQTLRQYDPYGHLVTTSYAEGRHTRIWKIPELSFMQQHDYTNNDPAVEFGAALADFRVASPTKPLLVGEHGHAASGEPPNVELAAAIVHFHNGLWAAPFSGLAGSALAWYWNDLVDPNGLWPQYKALATFFQGEDLAPTQAMTASLTSGASAASASAAVTRTAITASTASAAGSGAIALSLQSPTRALVWVRSQQFEATRAIVAYEKAVGAGQGGPNWSFAPPVLSGLTLTVHALQDGAYTARWFDPQTGQWLSQTTAQASGGALTMPVPDFSRDLALKLTAAH